MFIDKEYHMDSTFYCPHPVRVYGNDKSKDYVLNRDLFFDDTFSDFDVSSLCIDGLIAILRNSHKEITDSLLNEGLTLHQAIMSISSELTPYKYQRCDGTILTISE